MDQLPRLGKRELICMLLFTCNYVVSVWRGFLFHWVLWMNYVILLWHPLNLSYNYFSKIVNATFIPFDLFNSHLNDSKILIWQFTERHFRKVGSHSLTQRPNPLVLGYR